MEELALGSKILRRASAGSIAAGILAGFLGGIAGSGFKLVGEAIYPPRTQGQEPPPAVLAEKLAGHPLTKSQKTAATQTFHWTFGSLSGAFYGAVAEVAPIVTTGYGSAFGLVVFLFTHETTLPMLGLDKSPFQQPAREQSSEFVTHVMYGVGTEVVRRAIRSWQQKRAFEALRS
jgi:putative membrane protein